jgi:hypothetical protein
LSDFVERQSAPEPSDDRLTFFEPQFAQKPSRFVGVEPFISSAKPGFVGSDYILTAMAPPIRSMRRECGIAHSAVEPWQDPTRRRLRLSQAHKCIVHDILGGAWPLAGI